MKSITIQNEDLSARIDFRGAQLASLIDQAAGQEFIWQRDPAFWSDSAPNCFPIIGIPRDGIVSYNQRSYPMPQHGIALHAPFELIAEQPSRANLSLKANPQTRERYPFEFELEIGFRLAARSVEVEYAIRNHGDGLMPASINYHPGFNLDLDQFQLSDYSLRFSKPESLDLFGLNHQGLFLRAERFLESTRQLPLSKTLFNQDALIFQNIQSNKIELVLADSKVLLTVDTGGAPHVGFWAPPGAPFVCIEPWYSLPDGPDSEHEMSKKPGMFQVDAGQEVRTAYAITIC